ncbi:MAG: hypothetical protein R6U51_08115 [Anaerolineales bacterium]
MKKTSNEKVDQERMVAYIIDTSVIGSTQEELRERRKENTAAERLGQ